MYIAHEDQRYRPQDTCSICLMPFDPTIPQSVLTCGHRFCRDCINRNEATRWSLGYDNNWDTWLCCRTGNSYCYSQCPYCTLPYHIIKNKFDYDYTFRRGILRPTYMLRSSSGIGGW